MTNQEVVELAPLRKPSTPSRLSVSAIRDFNKCSWYYKLARIDKVPEDEKTITHHRWAGSVVHAAFMLAYGTPVDDAGTGSWRTQWKVDNDGSIEDALELFDMLWDGGIISTGVEDVVGLSRAQRAYQVLSADKQLTPPPANQFAFGTLKPMKNPNNTERKAAWRGYFREMLEASLEQGLPYPVVALEQEAVFKQGDTDMLGFLDITMEKPNGRKVYVDLKTGSRKPTDNELAFDDQMQTYYTVEDSNGYPPDEVWYFHMKSGDNLRVPKNPLMIKAQAVTTPVIMEKIKEGDFVRNISADCLRCSRRSSCM